MLCYTVCKYTLHIFNCSIKTHQKKWVCLKMVYPYTQWLMIIIPTKWLFHWGIPHFQTYPSTSLGLKMQTDQTSPSLRPKAGWSLHSVATWCSSHIPPCWRIPSGYVKIAMENCHRNSGLSHEKWWIFPLQTVSSPEGIQLFGGWFWVNSTFTNELQLQYLTTYLTFKNNNKPLIGGSIHVSVWCSACKDGVYMGLPWKLG